MSPIRTALLAILAIALTSPVVAQVRVTATTDQVGFLSDPNPDVAANKKLVFDFWREVLEGGNMENVEKYMTESYIQHNPNVPTGRAAFVDFFAKFRKPKPIQPLITAPLVSIVASGDLVVLSFVREYPDPKDPAKKYTTTWFDMFRIENGKIAEHWDSALKQ